MDENSFVPLDFIYNEIKLNPQFTELSPYTFMQCIKGFPSIVINKFVIEFLLLLKQEINNFNS